jgi:hypothetical protein
LPKAFKAAIILSPTSIPHSPLCLYFPNASTKPPIVPPPACFLVTHHQANAVIDQVTAQSYGYSHLITGKVTGHTTRVWTKSFANELGQLADGIGTSITKDTNTIFFINCKQVPIGCKITYSQNVCTFGSQRQETHYTCLTVGGKLIDYLHSVSAPTANITTTKIVFNSAVSTPNAKFMGFDIKYFYLNTQMARYEYIIDQYNLLPLVHDGTLKFVKACTDFPRPASSPTTS